MIICYLVHQKLVHSERHFSAPSTKKRYTSAIANSVRHFSDSKHPKSGQRVPKVLRVLPDESGMNLELRAPFRLQLWSLCSPKIYHVPNGNIISLLFCVWSYKKSSFVFRFVTMLLVVFSACGGIRTGSIKCQL